MIKFKSKDNEKDYRYVRETVFMKEQGFSYDQDDIDATAIHVTVYDGDQVVGCGRTFLIEKGVYVLGRLAVLQPYRKLHYGQKIISQLEQIAKDQGAVTMELHAQDQAVPFYEKQGYSICGVAYMDEHVEHFPMRKVL